jgi:hypothetical protein
MVNCDYAIVQQVGITSFDGTVVSFQTRSSADMLEEFTTNVSDVLRVPPLQAPDPVPLQPSAVGNLYLSRTGWATTSKAKNTIYGAGNQDAVLFKWPQCAPFRTIEPATIKPTSLVVTGKNLATGDVFTQDLLKLQGAQQLVWNQAAPLSIASGGGMLKIWPTKITIVADSGTLDNLLDIDYADFVQTFGWSNPGAAITIRLADAGFAAFGMIPQAVHAIANNHNVAYKGPIMTKWAKGGTLAKKVTDANTAAVLSKAQGNV